MSTTEMKATIQRYINEGNEEKIAQMYASVAEDEIVGYNIDGTPIFAEAFKKEAEEILQRMEAGEYRTLDELEKESAKW